MTKKEKELVKEVLHAMELHHAVLENNIDLHARIGKEDMREMEEGMRISMTKLELLLK